VHSQEPVETVDRESPFSRTGLLGRRTFLQLASAIAPLGALSAAASTDSPGRRFRVSTQTSGTDSLIGDLAFRLQYDRKKLVEFVANEIRYEPYAGALRGPIGTLLSGAGNSVDKAQLLKALFDASLISARFVSGSVSPSELRTAWVDQLENAPSPTITSLFAERVGITANAATPVPTSSNTARMRSLRDEVLTEANDRIDLLSTTLTDVLQGASITMPDPEFVAPVLESERHTWLQASNGAEWLDMPVTLGALPQSTGEPFDLIPEDWFHTVTVKVEIDRIAGALEHTSRSQDLTSGSFALVHVNSDNLTDLGFDLGALLEDRRGYHPTILAGSEWVFAEAPVNFGGGGGVLDVFETGPSELTDGETIAEFVEYNITSPEGEPLVSRRTLFDRAASLRSTDFDPGKIERVELVDVGAEQDHFLPLASWFGLAAISGPNPAGFSVLDAPVQASFNAFSSSSRGTQSIRQALVATNPNLPATIINRPNLVAHVYEPRQDATGTWTDVAVSADLLAQSSTGLQGSGSVPYGVLAGVRDLIAEETAFDDRLLALALTLNGSEPTPISRSLSVAALTEQVLESQVALTVISTTDMLEERTDLSDDERAMIQEHLDTGKVIVLPSEKVDVDGEARIGWWIFDPLTGKLTDQLDTGGGATLKEYALKLQIIAYTAAPFLANGECVAGIISSASDLIDALGGSGAWADFLGGATQTAAGCA
jgi:hypothetical protein